MAAYDVRIGVWVQTSALPIYLDRAEAMLDIRRRRGPAGSLLYRYGDQLGRIVERHRAEAALHIAKPEAETAAELAHKSMVEAQTANRAKTEFLANMSHEIGRASCRESEVQYV